MTIYPESIDTDLRRLLTDVQNGSMQLPEFQRDWESSPNLCVNCFRHNMQEAA